MFSKSLSFFLVVLILILSSCDGSSSKQQGDVVARVGDSYLYEGDIVKLIKSNMSESDSALVVDRYINRWARKKIILRKAELNLSAEEANFNRLIAEYREGLLTSAYRQKLVTQYLDTTVTDTNIEEFYNANKSNFVLNNDLVMVKYVNFPANISDKKNIIKMIKSDNLEDFNKLEALCFQFSNRFGISDSSWIPLNDLKMKMPELKKVKKNQLLKKGSFIEIQDSLHLYLTRILDVRKKKDIAPLSFVDERIRNIILNKRKLELISSTEKQLLEDAIKNREFETFK